jgi:hypothetical protein
MLSGIVFIDNDVIIILKWATPDKVKTAAQWVELRDQYPSRNQERSRVAPSYL